nr:N-acetylmuramoyl-L-alanine amidase [uncultured Celeribacter sp.]
MSDLTLHAHPSPNFGARRDGAVPDMVVLHYTAMQTTQAALERLCDPEFEVSAHYLIAPDGTIFALVEEEMRAWHAGAGRWGDVTDVNSRSIGIELANPGDVPFAAAQMDALERLLAGICDRWAIPPQSVIGHSDMAPARKCDPGPRFDWARLACRGLAVTTALDTVDPAPLPSVDVDRFLRYLHRFGYAPAAPEALLAAFRLRVRPRHVGPLDGVDMALAEALARRFPVDRAVAST